MVLRETTIKYLFVSENYHNEFLFIDLMIFYQLILELHQTNIPTLDKFDGGDAVHNRRSLHFFSSVFCPLIILQKIVWEDLTLCQGEIIWYLGGEH